MEKNPIRVTVSSETEQIRISQDFHGEEAVIFVHPEQVEILCERLRAAKHEIDENVRATSGLDG